MMKNMLRNFSLALLVLTALLSAQVACAAENGSLWSERQNDGFLRDHRASQIGDLLTIIIVEKAEANQKATTAASKDGSVSMGPGLGFLKSLPQIKATGGDDLSASGSTTRGGSLSAKMTVRVKEVLPNGNLVVEGTQDILVNKEEQKITVSGTVRPEDVTRDNTVLSTYVADARISYQGNGVVGDKQQPGLLTRIFNWLF